MFIYISHPSQQTITGRKYRVTVSLSGKWHHVLARIIARVASDLAEESVDAVAKFPASYRRVQLPCAKSMLNEFLASKSQVKTLVDMDAQ
jgi:hypothetical protein